MNLKMLTIALSGCAFALLAAEAPMGDQTFVKNASEGGMAEVKMGQMAASQGSNQKVKDFGKRMVDDHSKANSELSAIAVKKGVNVAVAPGAKEHAMSDKLSKLSG